LIRSWDGRVRPWVHRDFVLAAPTVSLAGSDYERWLASKSRNFRQDMRRKRRRLDAAGGAIRMIDGKRELAGAIDAMFRLHHARWARRGGSELDDRDQIMLRDAAPELLAKGRFRLWAIEAERGIAGALLCIAAGGMVAFWAGGFDDEWSRCSPEMLLLMTAIEDSFRRGESVFDLGGGDYPHKLRLADGDAPVAWLTLFPRDIRYPLARARTLRRHTFWRARGWAREHLSRETQERLKGLLRRG
jgi:CelD/BcsL family acetyltransferase involved in cellulose biosynthesis